MRVELKNYRAFDDAHPAVWRLHEGFVSFVGVNNSGKSSLLRFFHEARPALNECSNAGMMRELLLGERRPNANFLSVADVGEVFCNRNDRDMTATFSLDHPRSEDPSAFRLRWSRASRWLTLELELEKSAVGITQSRGDGWFDVRDSHGISGVVNLERYAAVFRDLAGAIYLGPFRNAVNLGGSGEYYDLAIGQQFIERWDSFKTGNDRAHNRAAISVERELESIFGIERLEINAAPGNATLQVIADDEPYQLQEQGAGLAQFIVVLAFVATREPTYIFIDEPELNLHPSLQLDFITTLARYASKGLIFATHSIGLARAAAEDVYSVRRLRDGSSEVRELPATRDYVEFLGELSLSGYAELGFERVLLVEGTTDVPVVQRWLRCYGFDHNVVLLPLGGGSMINGRSAEALGEIKRIAAEVSVLIDSERLSADEELSRPRREFVEACRGLGFDVHVTERRAIENYLPDAAVKKVKGEKYRALGDFEKLAEVEPAWSKSENWRIAAEMTRAELDATDLGRFFLSLTVVDEAD